MKKIVLFIIVMFLYSNMNGQQRVVSGRVLLNNEFTLGNISVSAKKSKAIVSSNMEGEYSIACEDNDVLTFSAALFKTIRKSVKGVDSLNVSMSLTDKFGDKNKMVDLGFIKLENIETVIKAIDESNYSFAKYTNVNDIIRDKFPSVTVRNESTFIIRGPNSITGSDAALLVLNGMVVNDFSNVDPNQITSINVLKSSDAVLYGMRGANGVIVIKTK